MGSVTYDEDIYTWSLEQASLLRVRKFDQIDLEHIIEEIEDMSKSEKRALQSFLETLLMHLLKWQFQPSYQGQSWKLTIIEQRKRIESHLQENPGLKSKLPELVEKAYAYAVIGAVRETGIDINVFPQECLWSYKQLTNPNFWPDSSLVVTKLVT